MADLSLIATAAAPAPAGHYAQAIEVDGLIFVSGQLPIAPDGTGAAGASFEDQVRQVLANLFAIIRAAGSAPERIVKTTVYIVGVERWPLFNALYAEALGSHRPARSVVPVPALHHGYLIEMEAIVAK